MVTQVTDATFEKEVLGSSVPVLVDYWAEWCGPCKMIAPMLEESAAGYAGRLSLAKLNVDENQEIAVRYGITGIPALLFFEGGQVVDTVVGAVPKSTLQKHVDGVLGTA